MLKALWERVQQKHRTMTYPDGPAPALPERFAGIPLIRHHDCARDCDRCVEACPTEALTRSGMIHLDLGRCLFCTECAAICPNGAISFTGEHQMASSKREDLLIGPKGTRPGVVTDKSIRQLFGKSFKLRQVSAGGCNACEADTNVLGTVGWDLGRFGIQFVASPRHADGLLITGPVPENMHLGLMKTYEAVPQPKLVIVVGACAISGGPYKDHSETHNGVGSLLPIDLYIPGCPPHPLTILDGLLRLTGRI